MWKGKILDIKGDIQELNSKIRRKIFKGIKKERLTPLEFTILECIFNNKAISGYDIIAALDKHFAGTWKARSGTVYPLLSKLRRDGFLDVRTVKSPIGPLRKVYTLTEAGEEILKFKVSKGFKEQLKFIENFLVDFNTIYLQTFANGERDKQLELVQTLIKEIAENVITRLPKAIANSIAKSRVFKKCSNCQKEIDRADADFCPYCGASLSKA